MRIYIAGPMSGLPSFNFPAFDAAARDLREQGYDVVSPAELDSEEFRARVLGAKGAEAELLGAWGECLARDVRLIADTNIEAVVLLPDWWKSRGANLEAIVGLLQKGMKFYEYRLGSLVAVPARLVLELIVHGFHYRGI